MAPFMARTHTHIPSHTFPSQNTQPYYRILPRTLSNMPVFWSEAELACLQGSYLLTQIEERKVDDRSIG